MYGTGGVHIDCWGTKHFFLFSCKSIKATFEYNRLPGGNPYCYANFCYYIHNILGLKLFDKCIAMQIKKKKPINKQTNKVRYISKSYPHLLPSATYSSRHEINGEVCAMRHVYYGAILKYRFIHHCVISVFVIG